MTSQKNGISALGLKRVLPLGSEQTAWAMLHRHRTAMVRTRSDLLSGVVEVDETSFRRRYRRELPDCHQYKL